MLIGWLRDGRRRDYLWVVNRSFRESRQVAVRVRTTGREVGEVSQYDGQIRPARYEEARRILRMDLLPGEGRLFVLA